MCRKISSFKTLSRLIINLKFVWDKTVDIMNLIEKRDFIHSYLHHANESTINEFYEKLRKDEVSKGMLENRALKSESDIQAGRVFSRSEIEKRTESLGDR